METELPDQYTRQLRRAVVDDFFEQYGWDATVDALIDHLRPHADAWVTGVPVKSEAPPQWDLEA